MVDLVGVDVIDNCFLWPMSNEDVIEAFGERVTQIQMQTRAYRRATDEGGDDDTTLPQSWPLSVFSNPQEPRALFVAKDTTQPNSFLGFLEAKMHARDYAKIISCVVLGAPRGSLNTDVTKQMFDALVADCVAMDIATITVPRNWSDYTTNEQYTSARYNFNTTDARQRTAHTTAICSALCPKYPYLVFKTPFKMQYILVTPQTARFLDRFVELFLNGPRDRTFDVYRAYNVSLWRLHDRVTNTQQMLTPVEVDIIVAWQRKQIAHQALELESGSNRPIRLFGKTIILAPEDPDRLVVVGARRRIDVPPQAVRAENHLWSDALFELARHPSHEEPEVKYYTQIDGDDAAMRARRADVRKQQNDQVRALEARMLPQQRQQQRQQVQPRRYRVRGQRRHSNQPSEDEKNVVSEQEDLPLTYFDRNIEDLDEKHDDAVSFRQRQEALQARNRVNDAVAREVAAAHARENVAHNNNDDVDVAVPEDAEADSIFDDLQQLLSLDLGPYARD